MAQDQSVVQAARRKLQLVPAQDIRVEKYSLLPDMMSGWKPKGNLIGPIPLSFNSWIIDTLVRQLPRTKLTYLGARPRDSFQLHSAMKKHYNFKYEHLMSQQFNELKAFFRKFYNRFQTPVEARPFIGQSPGSHDNIIFDSLFQGGNLDLAVRVSENEYDLFMRVDSNTKGHLQWYNFTAKSTTKNKVQLNICNFSKNKSLYERGMRPFLHSTKKPGEWKQADLKIAFGMKPLRYNCLDGKETCQLSFCYEFQAGEQIQLSYGLPYSYSRMIALKNQLLQQYGDRHIIREEKPYQSLSGLQIPVLTITDFTCLQKKKAMMIIGRLHPGESVASHVMEGFLKEILSNTEAAAYFRKLFYVKVLPMVNVDGVVLGNFRTSMGGKDLNRQFKVKQTCLFPEVEALKGLAQRLKHQHKKGLQIFLDMHGHSLRMNAFLFGPEVYPWDNYYYKCKIPAKILSQKTRIFRYQSCSFRLSEQKKSTARAYMMQIAPITYTLECSNSGYYDSDYRQRFLLSGAHYLELGKLTAISIAEYAVLEEQARIERERKRKVKKGSSSKHKEKIFERQQNIIEEIRIIEEQKEQNESDGYSSSGCDSQPESHDFDLKEACNLQNQVLELRKGVEHVIKNKPQKARSVTKKKNKEKQGRPIELISCMRKDKNSSIKQEKQMYRKRLIDHREQANQYERNNSPKQSFSRIISKQQLYSVMQRSLVQRSNIFEKKGEQRRGRSMWDTDFQRDRLPKIQI